MTTYTNGECTECGYFETQPVFPTEIEITEEGTTMYTMTCVVCGHCWMEEY